jgi:signal peptidase II
VPTTSDDPVVAPSASPRRRGLLIALVSITVVVLVLDQLSKAWALDNLTEGVRRVLVGDLLGLQLVFNSGAALSIATGMTWLLTIIAVAVIVVIVRASRRLGSAAWAVALGLLLGGALGNLVDRLVREPGFATGHVVDFIAYGRLFVGNVADIAIVGAAVLIVLLAARGIHIDGTRDVVPGDASPTEAADEERPDDERPDADADASSTTERNA